MTTKLKIPKIRFKEFSGEWEEKKLGEVSNIIMGQSPDSSSYNIDGVGKYLIQGNADILKRRTNPRQWTSEPTKECNEDDIIMTVRAPVGYIAKSNHNACIGRGVCAINNKKNNDKEFIYQSLLDYEPNWGKYSQGSTFTAVNSGDIRGLKLNFPQLPEQQKIASFLSSVDEKIEKIKEKKKNLEEYKKGVMQKIFSQEIRFKDENGEEYGEWKEKKLGEIGETYSGLTGKSGDDFGIGEPFITYKQIFDNSKIDTSKFALVSINSGEKQNKVKYGDIFFTISSETPQEVGMSAVLLSEIKENLYLNSFCFGFRISSFDILSPEFARFYFRYQDIRKKIIILAQGSTRYNISKNEMIKIKINLPNIKEQEKIADFLSEIDKKIEKVSDELEKMEEFKKGLLQGMFV